MTQSSCKRDTKSRSHLGMKLAPVRVFPCKHHLIATCYNKRWICAKSAPFHFTSVIFSGMQLLE